MNLKVKMADIKSPIVFTEEYRKLIIEKLSDKNFTYQDWSNDDLLGLRKFIRDYYRDLIKECSYC